MTSNFVNKRHSFRTETNRHFLLTGTSVGLFPVRLISLGTFKFTHFWATDLFETIHLWEFKAANFEVVSHIQIEFYLFKKFHSNNFNFLWSCEIFQLPDHNI